MQKTDLTLLSKTIEQDGLTDTLRISDYYNYKNKNRNPWENPHRKANKYL